MRPRLLPLLALVLVPFSGCLDSPDSGAFTVDDDAPLLDDALALWAEGARQANMALVGAWEESGAQEIDVWEHLVFADYGSTVKILDVSDPGHIQELGAVTPPAPASVLDVKVSHDGKWLFIGDDTEGSHAVTGAAGDVLGEAAGNDPFTGGFYVYDVSDPTAPEHVDTLLTGPRRGPHMVYHADTSVGELVLGANADVSINTFDRQSGTLTEQSRYSPMLTDWNRDPEVFDVYYQGLAHDMVVHEDEQDGVLLYVANWDAGLRIVDINDPAAPVELGKWMDFPEGHEGNLHTVHTAWIDDKRITVGSVEVGFGVVGGIHYAQGTDRSVVYVWDTDPTDPELLGWWENPDQAPAGRAEVPDEEITSTHNLQLVDGRIYLAHYGLGVWVLDVSTPQNQTDPQVLGYTLLEGQNTWDVVLHDGIAWTGGQLGVMGLHFLGDEIGDTMLRGTA